MLLLELLFKVISLNPFCIQRLQSHFDPIVRVLNFFLLVFDCNLLLGGHLTVIVAFKVLLNGLLKSQAVVPELNV